MANCFIVRMFSPPLEFFCAADSGRDTKNTAASHDETVIFF
jgi:hypothetical protein